MSSSTDSSKPHTFNPSTVSAPPPTFHHVAVTPIIPSSKLITLAGQVGVDSEGNLPDNFVDQVKLAFVNVANCLKAAGTAPRDIVHVRHYIVQKTGSPETDEREIFDRGWSDLWVDFMDREAEGHRPPDTVLGVSGLARRGLLYEVEVWAVLNG